MVHSKLLQLIHRATPVRGSLLELLLFFGLSLWVGGIPSGINGAVASQLADQAEQLIVAGSSDQLRIRAIVRKGNFFTDSDGSDNTNQPCVIGAGATSLSDLKLSLSPSIPAPIPYKKLIRYQQPSPREPPIV